MNGVEWWLPLAVGLAVAVVLFLLVWCFGRLGRGRETGDGPSAASGRARKINRRKERRKRERADASARLRAELEKYRERIGAPGVSGTAVEQAVREDPEKAARALRRMMKQ